MLTVKRLKELLSYDPETGIFIRIKVDSAQSRAKVGVRAGTLSKTGYRAIRIGRVVYPEGRLAWLYVHGELPPKGYQVDHINRIRDDNRIENLRLVTQKENNWNSIRNPGGSGFKGVYKAHTTKKGEIKWRAQIIEEGAVIHIGIFPTPEQAHEAYISVVEVLRGDEYAPTNPSVRYKTTYSSKLQKTTR